MPVRERLNLVNPDRLDAMVGQTVVILTRDGKQREGTISDVDQHNVTLAQPMDGGVLGMLLKRRDITEVKLRH
jgi:ribosome maturation factor RimP